MTRVKRVAALRHEGWCALVNPAAIHLPGRPRQCNCSAGIDQTPQDWYVEQLYRKKWKRVDHLVNLSQHDAEQIFFRKHCGHGRLISANGQVTIHVPHGEEKE